jgi:hypothetical protein
MAAQYGSNSGSLKNSARKALSKRNSTIRQETNGSVHVQKISSLKNEMSNEEVIAFLQENIAYIIKL